VHHFDLYRLRGPADFKKLALEESFSAAVSLVEWSERLQGAVPPARLDVRMHAAKPVRVPPPHCTPLHPTAPHWTTAPLHPTR
jgi:tRNA threonylcarbamoyladenosine biosynthesis protein TsaE